VIAFAATKAPDIDWNALSPAVALVVGLCLVLLLGLARARSVRTVAVPVLALVVLGVTAGLCIWQWNENASIIEGALAMDDFSRGLTLLFCAAGVGTVLLSWRSAAAAEAFAAPVLWRHAGPLPPGRTLSAAHDADIASIYAEASGGGTVTRPEAAMYAAGVRRVMASLGMLELDPVDAPPDEPPQRLVGEGDLDVPATVAPFDGLCETLVGPLDRVSAGQVVAIVTDPLTGERAEVPSLGDGLVVLARRGARVARDDNLVVLAQPESGIA